MFDSPYPGEGSAGTKQGRPLRDSFAKEMNGENTDAWLFNAYDPQTGYPGNLGYFIGFRICESYYNRSADKSTAIKELIEIKDFNRILTVSGYKGGE